MKSAQEDIRYQIALLEMMHVGPVVARKVIDYFGSAKEVLSAQERALFKLGVVGSRIIEQRNNKEYLNFADNQIRFCEEHHATIISYYSKQYPVRLKQCIDAPLVLYQRGNCDLNAERVVAVVGTRNCSIYGKEFCAELIRNLKEYDVTIVSGLAFGIDACAHNAAIAQEMYNIGVVAHGLDRMYPREHKGIAEKIINKGAILTDFPTETNPDRENFPKRNRIVAGMADAIVVIESAIKGGSMITAKLGNDYNRDVFAVPGRVGDERSEGCNHLIKTNQAHLLEKAADIAYILGWEKQKSAKKNTQKRLNFSFNKTEQKIINSLEQQAQTIDEVVILSGLSISEVSSCLLMLELKGTVKQLPGKKYEIV